MINMIVDQNHNLKSALDHYLLQSISGFPNEQELALKQSFSIDFENRMQRLIRKAEVTELSLSSVSRIDHQASNKRWSPSSRKRFVLAAILLAILISVFSVSVARESVFDFFVKIYETFSTIVFHKDANQTVPPTTDSISPQEGTAAMVPTILPTGYKQVDQLTASGFMQIVYANSVGDELIFERQLSDHFQMMVDTERITVEHVQIRQAQGLFYANKGMQTLIWQEGSFAYSIFGKITKDELMFIANSTKF
jgi:hypothetical protein